MLNEFSVSDADEIQSTLVTFNGASGLRVVAFIDEGAEVHWNGRVVILAPRYGETKKNNLQMAYQFVANGFKVLRFDYTNHIGESDGAMDQFTLSGASEDILACVRYIDSFCEPSDLSLVALSLSCRSGLRACQLEPRITRLVNIVGMVDMDSTLQAIYKRDFFGELSVGADWRMVDILGFEIDGKNFHDDLMSSGMKSLDGSVKDAAGLEIPILHLCAEKDRWVDAEQIQKVFGDLPAAQIKQIPDVGHEINENHQALAYTAAEMIRFCSDGLDLDVNSEVRMPSKKVLIRQNKIERLRLQEIVKFSDSEDEFWNDYLGKFGIIEDAHYYAEYFHKMASLLGAIKPRDAILDSGCGNGFYGVSVIHSLRKELHPGGQQPLPVHYCGMDLTESGLSRSWERQLEEVERAIKATAIPPSLLSCSYRKIDFDCLSEVEGARLPYADGAFNKICCSLVISYLKDPRCLLREFYRILAPGGVAVVSSMKPGCDMTVLYHSYVDKDTPDETKGDDANRLLSAAGKIKMKRDTGVYNFFSEEELKRLAFEGGFSDIRSCRSLGNQANVVRVVK